MGSFKPINRPQRSQDLMSDDALQLLDEEFDVDLDTHDSHLLTLELSNQFSSTHYN